MTRTRSARYAIVDRHGRITSLHAEPVPAGEGWGYDHELVELARPHAVGDILDYDEHGTEREESSAVPPDTSELPSWHAHRDHVMHARSSVDVYCETCARYLTGAEMDDPCPVEEDEITEED